MMHEDTKGFVLILVTIHQKLVQVKVRNVHGERSESCGYTDFYTRDTIHTVPTLCMLSISLMSTFGTSPNIFFFFFF